MHWKTKKLDLLNCNIHMVAAVWNQTHNISGVSLYFYNDYPESLYQFSSK